MPLQRMAQGSSQEGHLCSPSSPSHLQLQAAGPMPLSSRQASDQRRQPRPARMPAQLRSTTSPRSDAPPTIPRMSAHSRAHGQGMTGVSITSHRQVGDCVWWFGTDVADIEPGKTGQRGFSNVAAGRVDGTEIELEWADLPLGNILGGGGLTVTIDEGGDSLSVTEQRGDWGAGLKSLTRSKRTQHPARARARVGRASLSPSGRSARPLAAFADSPAPRWSLWPRAAATAAAARPQPPRLCVPGHWSRATPVAFGVPVSLGRSLEGHR